MFGNGSAQGCFIQHTENFTFVGHLHGGCMGIAVAGYDVAAKAFRTDDKFFAQFTGAQKQYFFHNVD